MSGDFNNLTKEEIGLLCGALNEVLECIEDWEFSIRLGCTKNEGEALLRKMNRLYDYSVSGPDKTA